MERGSRSAAAPRSPVAAGLEPVQPTARIWLELNRPVAGLARGKRSKARQGHGAERGGRSADERDSASAAGLAGEKLEGVLGAPAAAAEGPSGPRAPPLTLAALAGGAARGPAHHAAALASSCRLLLTRVTEHDGMGVGRVRPPDSRGRRLPGFERNIPLRGWTHPTGPPIKH